MASTPLVGPADGTAFRLRPAGPGRLALTDAAGEAAVGWVEPAGLTGATALVHLSTAGASPAAAAEVVASVVAQAETAGAARVVLDTDDARSTAGGVAVPPLRLSNSLGRREERFVPAHAGHVGVYSCGPTVYSYQHIGNMRTYVFSDTLKRALLWRGYDVRHVINITDVGHLVADADQGEDKVEEASQAEGRSVDEITRHYTEVFWQDLRSINVMFPDEWPKASAFVAQMISFAQVLQDHGFAYVLPQGLYFDTSLQADYGELAGLDTAGQRATGRVEETEGKRNPSDFALWRTFTDGRQRLMQWDSPWGVGAPGWHLECSVMSMALLEPHFDIHTGGIDHRELHHVNEIAQSEAYLEDGRRWVRYWLHGEFLTLQDRKVSKSAGDTLRVADLAAEGVHPLAFRYLVLQSHYRSQLKFSSSAAQAGHVSLRRLAARLGAALGAEAGSAELSAPVTLAASLDAAAGGSEELTSRLLAVDAAVAADLQLPTVIALVNDWSRSPDALTESEWAVLVRAVNAVTGLSLGALGPADFVPALPPDVDVAWVEDRLSEREAARAAKDWALADRMRDELAEANIRVEDTPEGTHWYWAGAGQA